MKKLFIFLTLFLTVILTSSGQNLKPVKDEISGKYGYKNNDDQWIIYPQFYSASKFDEYNTAVVGLSDKEQYIITPYGEIISPMFKKIIRFSNSSIFGQLEEDGKWYSFDADFNKLHQEGFDEIYKCLSYYDYKKYQKAYSQNVAKEDVIPEFYEVKRNNLYGIVNCDGQIIVPINYKRVVISHYNAHNKEMPPWSPFLIIKFQNKTNIKWGELTITNKEVIPFVYSNYDRIKEGKYFSDNIKPLFVDNYSEIKDEIKRLYFDVQKNREHNNLELSRKRNDNLQNNIILCDDCKWQHNDKGYYLGKDDKVCNGFYSGYENFENQYLVYKDNLMGIVAKNAKNIIPCKFSDIGHWNNNIYIVETPNNLYGLYDKNGGVILAIQYKFIDYPNEKNKVVIAYNGKQYCLIDKNGKVVSNYYDDIFISDAGNVYVSFEGYKTLFSTMTYKELSPTIGEQMFNYAFNLSDGKAKIEVYQKCIEYEHDAKTSLVGSCYNNMGIEEEKLGYRFKAKTYYEKAKDRGDENGRANYERIRQIEAQEKQEKMDAFFNSLNNLASNIAELTGNSSSSSASSGTTNLTGNSSSTSGTTISSTYGVNDKQGDEYLKNGSKGSKKCSYCGGLGECYMAKTYSGYNYLSKYHCGRSGKCQYCMGKGYKYDLSGCRGCVKCGGSVTIYPSLSALEKAGGKGSGKCKFCKGAGQCRRCHGTGHN